MKEQIRQRALELGFDDCRFTRADAPAARNEFRDWILQKKFGEMAWMERTAEKRTEPQLVLPQARSVVCVAASYFLEGPDQRTEGGIVARYARFDDYHDILGERLKLLAHFLSEIGGPQTRSLWYVDTGPVLERDFAQRAGIGFIGKHTNVISRKLGNWIFLAEILTTLELEPDAPEVNHCGKCSRCITACPTAAITAPFQLDARRCISYLTIELKGPIPEEFRRVIGNRIYGCDDCLAACPWNKFAREGRLMKSHERKDLGQADLIGLLSLDTAGFKTRFTGSPVLRTRRRGLLRNVCVALGNVGGVSALPALERAARDPEPLVAEHARWAIDRINERLTGKAPNANPNQPHGYG
ncbi:MAG TPA: tRNA epoxyqueuosine(34) reductase QueG [Verrucomicrobiae bacterium]|nr:tRNA epoxyqueuosine(34) reductase QueG [Verrucomicrobiae bacterium]